MATKIENSERQQIYQGSAQQESLVNISDFKNREVLLDDDRFIDQCVTHIGNIFLLAGEEAPVDFYGRMVQESHKSTTSTNRFLLSDKPEANDALQHATELLLNPTKLRESILQSSLSDDAKLAERYGIHRELLKAETLAHYEAFKRKGDLSEELSRITSYFEENMTSGGVWQHTLFTLNREDTHEAIELWDCLPERRQGTYVQAHEQKTYYVPTVGELELRIKEEKSSATAYEKMVRRAAENGGSLNHYEPHDIRGIKVILADAKYHGDPEVQAAKEAFHSMFETLFGDRIKIEPDNASQDASSGRIDWERDRIIFKDIPTGINPKTGEQVFAFIEVMYHGALDEINNAGNTANRQSHFLFEAKRRKASALLDYPEDIFHYGMEQRVADMEEITTHSLLEYHGALTEIHVDQSGQKDVIVSEPLNNAIIAFQTLYRKRSELTEPENTLPIYRQDIDFDTLITMNGRLPTIEDRIVREIDGNGDKEEARLLDDIDKAALARVRKQLAAAA